MRFLRSCGTEVTLWIRQLLAHSREGNLLQAKLLFDEMPEKNAVAWGIMLKLFATHSCVDAAMEIFYKMPHWNVIVCNILLSAYGEDGQISRAQQLFNEMRERSIVSWNTIASKQSLQQTELTHQRMPAHDLVAWNVMLGAYALEGHLEKVVELLWKMPVRDSVSWNTLLAVLRDGGSVQEAKSLFDEMVSRDVVSWTCLLQHASSRERDLCVLVHHKMPAWNSISELAILQCYIRSGEIQAARSTFDAIPGKSVAAWTAVLGGLGDSGDHRTATTFFHRMPQWSVISWTSLLRAHHQNASAASAIFATMPGRNITSWNAMLAVLAESSSAETAQKFFDKMPGWDSVSLTAASAMHARKGYVEIAQALFASMPRRDAVSWNAMVAAYGQLGAIAQAMERFHEMLLEGIEADAATLKSVLACLSHGGDPARACSWFVAMASDLGVDPGGDHYSCVVDVLGRCGRLCDAQDLLESIVLDRGLGDGAAAVSLIAACRTHQDLSRGSRVTAHLLDARSGSSTASSLSLLANSLCHPCQL